MTEGKTSFEGPLLKAVLDAVGAKGKTLKVKASTTMQRMSRLKTPGSSTPFLR